MTRRGAVYHNILRKYARVLTIPEKEILDTEVLYMIVGSDVKFAKKRETQGR